MSSGFITRVERDKDEPYTVIFTTDDVEKYEVIQAECRRLIGHAKPMEKLKPCPRCGDAWLYERDDPKPYTINCKCGYAFFVPEWSETKEEAINAWNRRVESDV